MEKLEGKKTNNKEYGKIALAKPNKYIYWEVSLWLWDLEDARH